MWQWGWGSESRAVVVFVAEWLEADGGCTGVMGPARGLGGGKCAKGVVGVGGEGACVQDRGLRAREVGEGKVRVWGSRSVGVQRMCLNAYPSSLGVWWCGLGARSAEVRGCGS